MAGRRQHYIPRFLQRGFLEPEAGGAERTWLYRAGGVPRLVGIRDVGVGEHFYARLSPDGTSTLDDEITATEGELDALLKTLRQSPSGSALDPTSVADLVVRLVTRTAHVRAVFERGMTRLFDEAVALSGDTNRLRAHLGVDEPSPSLMLTDALDSAVAGLPLAQAGIPPALVRRILAFMMRESFDELLAEQAPVVATAFAPAAEELRSRIRDAHNEALGRGLDQNAWIARLQNFTWEAVEVSDHLLLPDCVALVREVDDAELKPLLLARGADVDAVLLPLSSRSLLMGLRDGSAPPVLRAFNASAAACCEDFFIAGTATLEPGLHRLIGTRTHAAIEAVMANALGRTAADGSGRSADVQDRVTINQAAATGGFSFTLSCIDWIDENGAARLSEIVQGVVQELGRSLPLSSLDGLTLAADYADALRNLDRGDPALEPVQTASLAYGTAVARAVNVVRGGVAKVHVVIDACVGRWLLSDLEEDRTYALGIFVKELAYVAHDQLYERPLLGQNIALRDQVDAFTWPQISSLPSAYYTARESAFVDSAQGRRFATLVSDSLSHAVAATRSARIAYLDSSERDLDALLSVAVPAFSSLLRHTAEWLGHRDGLPDDEPFAGYDLPMQLAPMELQRWLELFGRDLRNLYSGGFGLEPDRLAALGSHLERLLWPQLILPSPQEDGQVFIHVLDDRVR